MHIEMNTSISVLIRSFNSAKTLGLVLKKLKLQSDDEIIIVDSGSTDITLDIANKYGATIFVAPMPFHYSTSLNLGFQMAKNSWVLVISSHAIPQVDMFLDRYREQILHFPDDVIVGYGPSTLSGETQTKMESLETVYYSAESFQEVIEICGNANTIYRRSAWVELPFDVSIRTAEDKIWISQMIKKNYRFAYIPSVPTLNQNCGSIFYMFKKGYRDKRTLRDKSFKPMSIYHLAGGFKNLLYGFIKNKINFGNFVRWSFQLLGQFFGSYQPEDNTPIKGAS